MDQRGTNDRPAGPLADPRLYCFRHQEGDVVQARTVLREELAVQTLAPDVLDELELDFTEIAERDVSDPVPGLAAVRAALVERCEITDPVGHPLMMMTEDDRGDLDDRRST